MPASETYATGFVANKKRTKAAFDLKDPRISSERKLKANKTMNDERFRRQLENPSAPTE